VTPGWRFVTYLQNHDQVGNRACGDRPNVTLSPGLVKIGAALLLCSSYTPMLFMGEEWGAATPWMFFTSFPDPELAEAVRSGRRAEFATHGWSAEEVADPQDPATFEASRLDWAEMNKDLHQELFGWYRQLIELRRARTELTDGRLDRVRCTFSADGGDADGGGWFVLYRGHTAVACNLSDRRRTIPLDGAPTAVLLASAHGFVFRHREIDLEPESVAIVTIAP
jgi:maltooligosyltrehalose trehalohydrolase